MAKSFYDRFTGTQVTQSIGSIIANAIGNSVVGPAVTNANLRLTDFTNRELLNLLDRRYPGQSRAITFDPSGLGLGQGGAFANTVGWYSNQNWVQNPDYWDIDGKVQHRFELDSAAVGSSYSQPGGIGTGTHSLVSQPLKADQRIYFEIHVNEYPKMVDSAGDDTGIIRTHNGMLWEEGGTGPGYRGNAGIKTSGNGVLVGGDVEIAIAPEGWATDGLFESVIGRTFMMSLKGLAPTNVYMVDTTATGDYKKYMNIQPDSDNDLSDINNGDVIMIAIDGVQDSSTTNNRIYYGKNGIWAQADSNNPHFGAGLIQNYNPANDSAGDRGGFPLEPTEDPYYLYISPIWDYQVKDSGLATTLGDYKYMDVDFTIKSGSDVTYSPPTSGRGHVFKAH